MNKLAEKSKISASNKLRNDSWTKTEDERLVEITCDYIATGKTQLAAFKYAGQLFGRTQQAVSFRFNSALRKQYSAQVKEAKKTRVELMSRKQKTYKHFKKESFPSSVPALEIIPILSSSEEEDTQLSLSLDSESIPSLSDFYLHLSKAMDAYASLEEEVGVLRSQNSKLRAQVELFAK